MKKIRAAIVGYGNIGKYVLEALEVAPDFEVAGVVRRNPNDVPDELKAYTVTDSITKLDKVDVAVLATPTRSVETYAKEILSLGINTVDSFDIHGGIVDLRRSLDAVAKAHNTVAVISAGWDPGSDSVVRALLEAMVPKGITYTNFGPGMSMGHTVAVKAIEGVKAALSMTIPMGTGVHRRMVYIEVKDGYDFKQVAAAIKADDYFAHDETHVMQVECVDNLLDMVLLTAEMRELKANPNRAAKGAVIEARLDKGRGPIMTVLVQNGTLKLGDIIIAGTAVGRVRTMINDKGQRVTEAGPSTPVEISGMSEVPSAGDTFNAVADERMARELAEERRIQMSSNAMPGTKKVSLEDLFSQIQAGEMKTLNVIVKADVQGSAEAVKASLEKISNEEVRVKVIHSAVGAINESDVMLAATSGAIIVGFNVRPDNAARDSAARSKVDMRMYRVIYDCINEIEAAMKGMLAPKFKEVVIGHAEVRETYKVSKVGTVCGCYCTDGKIQRGCEVRVLRDNIVIHEGELASLRRFKDDVKEVASGYECGMQVEKFNDIKVGDVIECFVMEQINA